MRRCLNDNRGLVALFASLLALAFSMSGLAEASGRPSVRSVGGHPIAATPHAGGILTLGTSGMFPASAIPEVPAAKESAELGGKKVSELELTCPQDDVDIGTWCLESAPYPLTNADLGKNDYLFATQTCAKGGGWLPSAAELLGAAEVVRLESTIHDNKLTATVDEDVERGLKDQREMSSTLITTQAGPGAAGVKGSRPLPETTQYVTVYSNGTKGGFAGGEPVAQPENFRCAYHKALGALQETEEE